MRNSNLLDIFVHRLYHWEGVNGRAWYLVLLRHFY